MTRWFGAGRDDGDDGHEFEGEATCTGETDRAIFVIGPDVFEGEEVSLPKSQIHDDSTVVQKGDKGTLVIKRWLARQRGWL